MSTTKGLTEDHNKLNEIADKFKPDIKIYFATRVTLRYSFNSPCTYINSNIISSLM